MSVIVTLDVIYFLKEDSNVHTVVLVKFEVQLTRLPVASSVLIKTVFCSCTICVITVISVFLKVCWH